MKTTPALIQFLQQREEFRAVAYDDQFPRKVLEPGDEVVGTLTYGYGTITRPDGSPLQIGDTISEGEALDRLTEFVRLEVEPVIENLIHVELTPEQYDAFGSVIYNFGASEVSGWRLVRRINEGDDPANIAMEWLTGTYTSAGVPMLGLYRRRIMEVLMFFGLDWRAGVAVSWDDGILSVLEKMGWDGSLPKPGPAHTPTDFDAMEIPAPPSRDIVRGEDAGFVPYADRSPEEQRKADEYFETWKREGPLPVSDPRHPNHVPVRVIRQRDVVDTPNVDPALPPKPMEESETHRGLSKAESGREAVIVGTTATVITGSLPLLRDLTGFLNAVDISTLLRAGVVFGFVLLAVGAWRWWRGKIISYEGRLNGTQPKV